MRYFEIVSQNVTLQKTLQTLELNAKKQQDISKRTVRELGQRLDQLALENAQKDQQAQNLRKEVNRLFREKKTKVDGIISSYLSLFITCLYQYIFAGCFDD